MDALLLLVVQLLLVLKFSLLLGLKNCFPQQRASSWHEVLSIAQVHCPLQRGMV